jgi:hypothetical protein
MIVNKVFTIIDVTMSHKLNLYSRLHLLTSSALARATRFNASFTCIEQTFAPDTRIAS